MYENMTTYVTASVIPHVGTIIANAIFMFFCHEMIDIDCMIELSLYCLLVNMMI